MNKLLLLIFISFNFLYSCKTDNSKSSFSLNDAYLGGEIVNPETNYILLFNDNVFLDTIALDEDNKFGYIIKEAKKGLYSFKHSSQTQVIYIEPQDSLLLRLNTYEFDESLAFTGRGGKRNNYLLEMYLLNEESNKLILEIDTKNPEEFDSLARARLKMYETKLNKLLNKKSYSKEFKYLAKQSMNYEYYDLKERYYFTINKFHPEIKAELDNDFFDYRKKVNFNDDNLKNNYVYLRFLSNYLKNVYIDKCSKKCFKECNDFTTFDSYVGRLQLADSLFKNPTIKSRFITNLASASLITANDVSVIDGIIGIVSDLDLEETKIERLKTFAELQSNYLVRNTIMNRELLSAKNKTKITLGNIIKKPTILMTWSKNSTERQLAYHKRLLELQALYPEIQFLAVNIDPIPDTEWLRLIKQLDYVPENEYKLQSFSEDPKTLAELTRRILFLNKESKVVQRSINFLKPEFEDVIVTFLETQDSIASK